MDGKLSVHDCIPCIIRPITTFAISNYHLVHPDCEHEGDVRVPKLETTIRSLSIVIISNVIIVLGFVLHLLEIQQTFASRREGIDAAFDLSWISMVLFYNTTFCYFIKDHMKYTNFLIALVRKRRLYGVHSCLSHLFTNRIRRVILCVNVLGMGFLTCNAVITLMETFSVRTAIKQLSFIIANLGLYSLATYVPVAFVIYYNLLMSIYKQMNIYLEDALDSDKRARFGDLYENIRYIQAYYYFTVRNYKKHMLSFGNLLFFIILTSGTVAHFVYGQYYLKQLNEECGGNIFTILNSLLKHNYWIHGHFLMFCYLTEKITTSVS